VVLCMRRTIITDTYSRRSGYEPEAVANPRTPNSDSTFLGTLRDEPAAGWQGVKTRWELVEERMAFESWAAQEMTRAPAVAEVREEIILVGCIRGPRAVSKLLTNGLGADRFQGQAPELLRTGENTSERHRHSHFLL